LNDEIAELEQKAAEPDFWNDLENSQKVLQRLKTVKAKVEWL
jgi:peptide chain release factor 2